MNLAVMDMTDGSVEHIDVFTGADNMNPQFAGSPWHRGQMTTGPAGTQRVAVDRPAVHLGDQPEIARVGHAAGVLAEDLDGRGHGPDLVGAAGAGHGPACHDAETLVLDVKVGSGAFMKTREQARALAQSLVNAETYLDALLGALNRAEVRRHALAPPPAAQAPQPAPQQLWPPTAGSSRAPLR